MNMGLNSDVAAVTPLVLLASGIQTAVFGMGDGHANKDSEDCSL